MVLGAAYMAIDFRTTSNPASYVTPLGSLLTELFDVLPTFLIMFGYFSHDFSLSFSFLLLVCAAPIVHFLYKLYQFRSYFQKLQRDGLVGSRVFPPQSLKVQILIARRANGPPPSAFRAPPRHQQGALSNLPRDAHAHYLPSQIHLQYPSLGPVYYLDMWPFAPPFLVATSPTVISQLTQSESHLPNHPDVRKYLLPIAKGGD